MNRTVPLAAAALAAAVLVAGCGSASSSTTTNSATANSTTSTETTKAKPKAVTPQPFYASGLLKGDAKPTFPDGAANKVAVIAQAPIDKDREMGSATLTFAFRNNTAKAISHVDWTATARAGGKLIATGSSQGTQPAQVGPGEVGMAYIYFDAGNNVPASGATYAFSPDTTAADTSSYNTAPLVVGEAARTGTKIVGSATNKTGKPLTGPYSVGVYCFKGNKLTSEVEDFAEETGHIAPNGTVHFTADLYDAPCKTYALGVSGFFS